MPNVFNEETRLLARFHPEVNNRGLNIYNPYFAEAEVNAVYLLFSNSDPAPLLSGLRSLRIPGAIVAGSFEKDPAVAELVDDLHSISASLGTIGMVSNRGGRLWGLYQGGYGLHDSILESIGALKNRRVVIVGAGNVAHALLLVLTERADLPMEVAILNRTVDRAERLAERFEFVTEVGGVPELHRAAGDVLINTTPVGSVWCTDPAFHFDSQTVDRFSGVADVVFVPTLTDLARAAVALNRPLSPGYRMFLSQARVVLRETLGHDMESVVFERHMLTDFEKNWA